VRDRLAHPCTESREVGDTVRRMAPRAGGGDPDGARAPGKRRADIVTDAEGRNLRHVWQYRLQKGKLPGYQ
jgi:hypothetical protein